MTIFNTKNIASKRQRLTVSLGISLGMACALFATQVAADDIDIYVGSSTGASGAANVMFLVDNSPNWSRMAQHWPGGGTQGAAEMAAISSVLGTIPANQPMNIGLSMLTAYAGSNANGATPGTGGGYIRFGARDMTVAANRNALQAILAEIQANITSPSEKVAGMANKDETAGFYELYKYFSGLAPYSGIYAQNPNADIAGNPNQFTAAGQGLPSGFAIGSNGYYQSPNTPTTPCAKSFIIYIANNANNTGSNGQAAYEPPVVNVGNPLAPTALLDNWTDEWTKYLYTTGALVPPGNNNGSIVTYILDAYHDQNNAGYTNALQNAAKVGGGKYFQVGSQQAIIDALKNILVEIQGVNSTFASASLPVNATNRQTDKNQVFIPMFRPDANGKPRWMGNLKQYQFILPGNSVELGDAFGNLASSTLTGFLTDCATSFWTTDSGNYWSNVPESTSPAGKCPTTNFDPFSDSPDGPIVEKGGVAEVIRKGNNPSITNNTPTWLVNRNIYTQSGNSMPLFTAASSGLSPSLVSFIQGQDVTGEVDARVTPSILTRPSLHGDSIHSQPTAIDYGGTNGVTVYYGSNDGTLRAIDASSGQERWAFIAPEFFAGNRLQRLMDNSPLINYPGMPAGINPPPLPKDYFFDGSIGVLQNSDNSKVWIYPAMRRGGRMVYALDASNPNAPTFKWKVGCPDFADDTGCTTGFSGIGQTWSKPVVVANILGYVNPVVIFGGGYDGCEDANNVAPACLNPKGAMVYIVDADNGALLASFPTTRSVVADISLVSVATAGVVDHAYVADLGGNIYRIDFDPVKANWKMNRVAYTNGAGRKFFYAPAVLPAPGGLVYLALGSGDREHPLQSQYPYSGVLNRFYVYKDDTGSTAATNLDSTTLMTDFSTDSSCSTAGILPSSNLKGWFMNMNQYGQGEQVVNGAQIAAGLVVFGTNRPIPATPGSCSTGLGEARGYWLNLFNGSGSIGVLGSCGGERSSTYVGGGLPPTSVIGTVLIGNKRKTVIIGATQKGGGASTTTSPQEVLPSIVSKRSTIYWKSSGQN